MTADGAGQPQAPEDGRPSGRGRLTTGTIWALLILGLWIWGRAATDGGLDGPAHGDVSAAGRQFGGGEPLPAAHAPLDEVGRPVRLEIPSLDIRARIEPTGLDDRGGVAAPPYARAGAVGWYREGPKPGERGVALVVGHVDTDTRRAVFYGLSTVERGTEVRVTGENGRVAQFTVESAEVVQGEGFEAERAYGQRERGRAELRLLTCGGTYDRQERAYTSNVVVSAYLTGTHATA
ncbi:class F sortase [Streptomyces sp. RKND-216]|uniref:class F sortase n=1 Tax=Streptomyces sp. RKND-216 TaxID=2562581 RepID=UPI00109DCC65|nr:class F sortase [Streptomyces sp. RKND-216]THA26230.1 class F sortase [Streptomyces sp. RKND-216]